MTHSAPADERLKGNPHFIRVDNRETNSEIRLQTTEEYLPGALAKQKQAYQRDGSPSYRFEYEYDESGQLSREITYWQDGLHSETRYLPPDKEGVQETVTLSAAGEELERVITRRDKAGNVRECTNLSESGPAHLSVRYDDEGNFLDAKVKLPDNTELTLPLEVDPAYRIVTRDAEGNWTEKTTPFGILYRTIEYY